MGGGGRGLSLGLIGPAIIRKQSEISLVACQFEKKIFSWEGWREGGRAGQGRVGRAAPLGSSRATRAPDAAPSSSEQSSASSTSSCNDIRNALLHVVTRDFSLYVCACACVYVCLSVCLSACL